MATGSGRSSVVPALQIPAYLNRSQGALDASGAEDKLRSIDHAITQIYQQNASKLSFQALYTAGYHIVLHKHGDKLYAKVEAAIKAHVHEKREQLLAVDDGGFLPALLDHWQRHRTAIQMIRDILMYMDKNYIPQTKRLSVYELGVKIFGDNMLKNPDVGSRVRDLTLAIVAQERAGEKHPGVSFLLKDTTQMMLEVNRREVYEQCLERHFLQASTEFYRTEAAEIFHTLTTPQYLRRVFQRLAEEQERVQRCLADRTKAKVEAVIKDRMIQDFTDGLLEKEGSGCVAMLTDWRLDDLQVLYNAFYLIKNTAPFTDRLQRHLLGRGAGIVAESDGDDPIALVENVMKLRTDFDDLLRKACTTGGADASPDPDVDKAVRDAFTTIVNKNPRFAEYLSLFVDSRLRKRGADCDCEADFEHTIALFRFLRDKDLFEKYYKNHLTKRLLFGKSGGEEAERAFIAKLKQENGHQFTSKIEGMLKDMALSVDTMENFRQRVAERRPGDRALMDLNVQVLTTGFWPLPRSLVESTVLPPEAERVRECFQQVYLSSHNGRRLTWQLGMGSADIRFTPQDGREARKFELNVHTLQMVVLMLFNSQEQWVLRDIAEETKVPFADLRKQVIGLTMQSKQHTRVLNRSCAATRDVDQNTVLTLNTDFKSKHVKIRILSAAVKETEDEVRETRSKVDGDRKWQIEAVIVRIMKSRRVMEHRGLINECIASLQSRFAPTPEDIKKRIESLIEREYLERSKDNHAVYNYLA